MKSILQFKKVNCKNCYKCVRYCPVKSIEVTDNQAQIIERDCIHCGTCTIVCPQKAKLAISDIEDVRKLIRDGKQVIASVAPSFIAYFGTESFSQFKKALKELHFSDAYETAEGAFLVKSEYEKLVDKNPEKVWISSCCSTVNSYIRKHFPEAIPYLAPVITPMQAHAEIIKQKFPESTVVFIGPCISKKAECLEENTKTDYVLTFGEIKKWLEDENIEFQPVSEAEEKYRSRLFPYSSGILETMNHNPKCDYVDVSGIKNCAETLKEVTDGKLKNCFIEMSACENGCINGPSFRKHRMSAVTGKLKVRKIASETTEQDYAIENGDINTDTSFKDEQTAYIMPSEKQISAILRKMGKNSEADELNCGMCGYSTCREKAIAVYFKKADISMCLPFMKERAESFSDKILNITPNAIIAVDMDLKVQQINNSACEIFGILNQSDILNQPVSRILDEFDFVDMITSGKTKETKRSYLAEYNIYLEQVFLFDQNTGIIICIMKNITKEKQKQSQIRQAKLHAVSMADDIVDKQLRIVHEIASLLGETAAETKVAVTELKETIMMENDD